MRVMFNDLDQIEEFLRLANELESDITVGAGRRTIDGKSQMGMMQLTLGRSYDVTFIERDKAEVLAFINVLKERGIAI